MKSTIKKPVAVLLALLLTFSTVMLSAVTAFAASDNALTVTATSNVFPAEATEITNFAPYQDTDGEAYVAVEYKLFGADKYLINFQGVLTWDNTVLEFKEAYNTTAFGSREVLNVFPFAVSQGCGTGIVNTFNDGNTGRIACNYSSVVPAAYANEEDGTAVTVVKAVFRVLNRNAETTVDCAVNTLALCDDSLSNPYTQYFLVNNNVAGENPEAIATCTTVIESAVDAPVHEHTYDFVNGVLQCTDCGELFSGEYTDGKLYADGLPVQGWIDGAYYADGKKATGITEIDGVYYTLDENGHSLGTYTGLLDLDGVNYYADNGVLTSGWFEIDGDWYYFLPDTLAGANGTVKNESNVPLTYENGKLLDGAWELTIGKYRYWYGPSYYKSDAAFTYFIQEIDGDTYLFNSGGYRETGMVSIESADGATLSWYDCGTDGKAVKMTGPQLLDVNGKRYYLNENGESVCGYGLVKFDGNYYYVIYDGSVKLNGDRTVTEDFANGLLPAGTYHFDETGKMTDVPLVAGIDADGYYRENGEIVPYKGLVLIDGDYYFVVYDGRIKKDGDRTVVEEKTNGLLPAGTYHFGPDGKMTDVPSLEGIGADGYYRENGQIAADKGLIKIGDDYYFVIYDGRIKKDGDRTVVEGKANGLLPAGTYHFGPDGKMTDVPTLVSDGIGDDGYYRENGEIVPDKGLIKIGDDYYFVIYNGKIKKDGDRTVVAEKTNGLLPAGTYHFGADGKMTNVPSLYPDGIGDDGYYRENGQIVPDKGLIKIGDDYYFVIYDGRIKKNGDRTVVAEKTNGLLPAGTYHFGPDGKMVR